MTKPIPTVAIIGLGLLGASLGMALRDRGFRRLGWARQSDVRRRAVADGVVDETGDELDALLAQADLTLLCLPIPVIIRMLAEKRDCFKRGSVVTDIGSVKSVIVAAGELNLAPRGVFFIGSHPMAGTEKSGYDAAFPHLYDNAEVFVTASANSDPAALRTVADFWRSIGTVVRQIPVAAHDELVAHTSHISHLLALALTLTVLDCGDDAAEEALRYSGCATGFRDTSRIASSMPAMWREIMEKNRQPVLDAARRFERTFAAIVAMIEQGEFDRFEAEFARGKALRDAWIAYKQAGNRAPEHS